MLDSSLACVVLHTSPIVVTACFRTRNIHTLHSPVYFCWPLGCLGVSLCLGRLFLERGIFTHLLRPFIYVTLIISVHGCFTAVTIRHEPSRIVAARVNLATRPDRHDPSTFSGVDAHYLKFTSAILSRDMTSGVTVETFGDDL